MFNRKMKKIDELYLRLAEGKINQMEYDRLRDKILNERFVDKLYDFFPFIVSFLIVLIFGSVMYLILNGSPDEMKNFTPARHADLIITDDIVKWGVSTDGPTYECFKVGTRIAVANGSSKPVALQLAVSPSVKISDVSIIQPNQYYELPIYQPGNYILIDAHANKAIDYFTAAESCGN